MNEGQELPGSLLEAGEDPPELLELVEEALNELTLLVQLLLLLPLLQAVGFGRDHHLAWHGLNSSYHRPRVITLVSNHPLDLLRLPALQQCLGWSNLVVLPTNEDKPAGVA